MRPLENAEYWTDLAGGNSAAVSVAWRADLYQPDL